MRTPLTEEQKAAKRAYNKQYRLDNAEKVREQQKAWREANPAKVKAMDKKYRQNNPAKISELQRKWAANNPEKAKANKDRFYDHLASYINGVELEREYDRIDFESNVTLPSERDYEDDPASLSGPVITYYLKGVKTR